MPPISENNKRIAKNTLVLYLRMLILLLVSLYSSRVVLHELGVEDFGIYNIVGGIVGMFTFLNTTMSGATSRFLTFELGRSNNENLKETFKASFTLHILIGILILFVSETVGLWFVNHKLVIPEDRMPVANIVYQLSIFTIIIKTVQVPFNASIISHERMNVYAILEIINAIVILGFVYMLQLWSGDKLVIYAFMLLSVNLGTLCIYVLYCKSRFSECKLKTSFNWKIMKPILSFSGFNLYGNMGVTVRAQGINIILNIFFGTLINAANGIATQVQAAILVLSNNITLAFRPQIIKNYALNEIKYMETLVNYCAMFSIILFSIFVIPLLLELPYILKLWLVTPPLHTINITRIAIIVCWVGVINSTLTMPIHATGKIKALSFWGGTLHLLTVPVAYLLVQVWNTPETAYYIILTFMFFQVIATSSILKHEIPEFSLSDYWFKTMLPCLLSIGAGTLLTVALSWNFEEGFLRLALVISIYLISILMMVYLIVLKKSQRADLRMFIKKKRRYV